MELRQLECFVAVVEEGGFNRATTRLHMTQPAISYQIKLLETDLDIPLFYRRSRGISPTEAGRVLYEHAQMIQDKVRKAHQALERLSNEVAGEVRIGTVNSVGIYFLPEVLHTMRIQEPSARPTVLYRNSYEIIDALLANQVDLALVANPQPDRRLRLETIVEENISLVSGKSSPFYGRQSVEPDELRGQPFASLTTENPTGQIVRDYLAMLGVNVEIVVSTDNVETVREMVETGLGSAFLPDMVTARGIPCEGYPLGPFSRAQIKPPLTRRIVLVTWKNVDPTPAVAAFLDELKKHGAKWKDCIDKTNLD
jgi:LysR family nitrogen assimilation transcriptional regulator